MMSYLFYYRWLKRHERYDSPAFYPKRLNLPTLLWSHVSRKMAS